MRWIEDRNGASRRIGGNGDRCLSVAEHTQSGIVPVSNPGLSRTGEACAVQGHDRAGPT